jgi:IS30 family transposase
MSHLTDKQRYTIYVLLKEGKSKTEISKTIGRDKSVISREIARNKDLRSGEYRHDLAQRKYEERLRTKSKRIRFTEVMKTTIKTKLTMKHSPEQIVGYCKQNDIATVSIERMYQYIWKDKKKGGALYKSLRTQGKRYRKRGDYKDSRGVLRDRKNIKERPAEVQQKERFGDLEIDTIVGKNHQGAIVTINDRATGILRMKTVPKKEAELVKAAAIELLQDWKPFLHTITSDNGKEFAKHKEISQMLDIDYYFANPYHSWERGANENLNGLIRQYIKKSSCFQSITDDFVRHVQEEINNRPRKRFNFISPNQLFNQKVAFVT